MITKWLSWPWIFFAVVRAAQVGWRAFEALGPLAGGLLLLALFVVIQRVRQVPLVRLGIFRTTSLGGWRCWR